MTSSNRMPWPYVALLVLVGWSLAGCGGQQYKLAPVSGRVTLDGNPMENVVVTFQPMAVQAANPNPGPGSNGLTDIDGRYSLKTVEPAKEGAVVAKHCVYLSIRYEDENLEEDLLIPREVVLPRCCRDGSLEFEVAAGGSDRADFDLTTE